MFSSASTGRRPSEPFRMSLPRFILLATSIVMVAGVGALAGVRITGDRESLRAFFCGPCALLLLMLAGFEFALARMVVRQFSEGEPLRPAWFLIMLGGGCHLAGVLCVHILSANTPLNPLLYGPGRWLDANADAILRFGVIARGPLQMMLMASGLWFLLRMCRRMRIAAKPTCLDAVLILVAGGQAFAEVPRLAGVIRAGQAISAYDVLTACNGPLLAILLVEALVVKRSLSALGSGMVVRCWTWISTAIFLTVLGNMASWMFPHGLAPASWNWTAWHTWLLSSTAYALGPAWQLEAIQRARGEISVPHFSPFAHWLSALRLITATERK